MKTFILGAGLAIISHVSIADIKQIDTAANTMNIKHLQVLSQQSQGYNQAYANYRLAISANVLGQKTLAIDSVNQARLQLEALNQSEENAENLALLASVYGMQIALDATKASTLAGQYSRTLKKAQQLAPDNPRVKLIQAISAFNTPRQYGGSMHKAQALATESLSLFELPCDEICWGHAEAYVWRGLAKQNMGDIDAAIQDWQQALVVQADYGWAKFLLQQN